MKARETPIILITRSWVGGQAAGGASCPQLANVLGLQRCSGERIGDPLLC